MMPRIELSDKVDKKILEIADLNGLKSDLFGQQTRKDVLDLLIAKYEQSKPFEMIFEKFENYRPEDIVDFLNQKLEKDRKVGKQTEKLRTLSMEELEQKAEDKVRGSAKVRIMKIIEKIMTENDRTEDSTDKVYITQTYIKRYIEQNNILKTRHQTVQEALKDMENVINKHHKKHGLSKNHNIRAAAALKRRDRQKGR